MMEGGSESDGVSVGEVGEVGEVGARWERLRMSLGSTRLELGCRPHAQKATFRDPSLLYNDGV